MGIRQRHQDQNETDVANHGSEAQGRPGGSDLLAGRETSEDQVVPSSLRPQCFDEYIGQSRLMDKLKIYVSAAKHRGEALDHVLLHGPPGLGKTTLAMIIAHEMGVTMHSTSGPAVEHKGILAGLLSRLEGNEVLFIDEIHRMSPIVEESLYSAMEDGRIDIPMGEGSSASTMSIKIAPFTLVGATTRTAMLSAPLRDRFHIIEGLEFYEDQDLATIVKRTASLLDFPMENDGAEEIGRRSRGTPRIANRLTRRIRDFLQFYACEAVDRKVAGQFLERLGVDDVGLDGTDRRILETIAEIFSGGPVGIDAIAASMGLPRDTLEDVNEPFLLQRGFLVRTPRGRMITAKAEKHLHQPRAALPS